MNQDMIENFMETAKVNLTRDGNIVPIIFLEKKDGTILAHIADYSDDESKQKTHFMIGMMLKTGQFKSYLHIAESYFLEINDKKTIKALQESGTIPRPSQSPERKEVIAFTYKDENGKGFMAVIPFYRTESNKFIFDNVRKMDANEKDAKVGGAIWELGLGNNE